MGLSWYWWTWLRHRKWWMRELPEKWLARYRNWEKRYMYIHVRIYVHKRRNFFMYAFFYIHKTNRTIHKTKVWLSKKKIEKKKIVCGFYWILFVLYTCIHCTCTCGQWFTAQILHTYMYIYLYTKMDINRKTHKKNPHNINSDCKMHNKTAARFFYGVMQWKLKESFSAIHHLFHLTLSLVLFAFWNGWCMSSFTLSWIVLRWQIHVLENVAGAHFLTIWHNYTYT